LKAKHSIDWKIRSSFSVESKGAFANCLDTIEWVWYVKVEPCFFTFVGIATVIFSVMIVVGEILIFTGSDFGVISYLINSSGGYVMAQLLCWIPLFYLSICVYFALFNVNLAGMYGLYPHHQTDAGSLIFSGMNFMRISAPLAYNFLQMINVEGTAFMNFMGLEHIPVSKAYQYFPWLLVVLIVFNIFDCYGKILSALGLTQFKFSDTFSDERIDEGKKLIYKARLNKERNFLSLNTTNLRNYSGYSNSKMKLRSDASSSDYESPSNTIVNSKQQVYGNNSKTTTGQVTVTTTTNVNPSTYRYQSTFAIRNQSGQPSYRKHSRNLY